MTVEELEIIVTAKTEEVVKELMKIMPAIKQVAKQAQEAFSKIDTKEVKNKFQQAVQFVKKKMQDLKKSTEKSKIAIKVTNDDAHKQITQLEKEIDSLQKKISGRELKLNITNNALDKMRYETNQEVIKEMPNAGAKRIGQQTELRLYNNDNYMSLVKQSDKLNNEIIRYNALLDGAKAKMAQLGQETQKTGATQSKLSSFFSAFKQKLEQAKPIFSKIGGAISGIAGVFSNLGNKVGKVFNAIKQKASGIGGSFKGGLKHVLKYAGALMSIRGIYGLLRGTANAWLSSQNAGAKQLSANIDYMKYAMGSALAPVIQFVTNLVYQLMKAIQSVVYALFRVNIFAKASAKSYASMAGNAKKAKEETKQLAGVHDEINNIQDNKNSDSGNGTTVPNIDLSGIDNQMSPLAQKFYDFFKPLKESWDTYGAGLIEQVKITASQVGSLIASVWGSFENIITNGTVYTSLELILQIIGNIAQTFSNAWNYNGNGDIIVQNLANAFNNLLGAINNIVQSEGFQNWLNNCSDKFREITEKIASIDWQPLIDALTQIGQTIGTVALDILSGLVDIFKWLVENPMIAEILLAIGVAISIVAGAISLITTVMGIYNAIMPIATAVSTAFGISVGWLVAIIVGIIAVITAVVLAIMNWDTIMKALADTWEWIKQKATEIFTALGEFFSNLWQGICDTVTNVWNGIKDFFIGIWNAIVDFVVGIITGWIEFQVAKFEFIKNIVVTVFNTIKDFIVNIWNGIVGTISNVWNTIVTKVKEGVQGAWNAITSVFGGIANWFGNIFKGAWEAVKNVFSAGGKIFDGIKDGILNGLKSIVNAIIGGINKVIAIPFNGINTALRAIRSVNIMGLQPFSWINTIGVPQIPKLAKGGVLTEATTVIAGEYSGAKTNPEIVTPQNIMYDTVRSALEDTQFHNNNEGQTIHLNVYVGNKKIGQILIDNLRDMTRRTGKDIEALVGG